MASDAALSGGLFRGVRPFPAVVVLVGVTILLGLGVWQLKRLHWKENLLARIAALQTAPPEPLGVVLHRLPTPDEAARSKTPVDDGEVDFVRVQTTCPALQQTPTLHLYAVLDGVMGDRLITACPISTGPFRSLLVDRGFVPSERLGAVKPGPAVTAPLIGVLRKAERPNWLAPPNAPAANDWHTRDVPAMAAALHAPDPAPVMLMLESPKPASPWPRPAAIPTDIPNNHLGYALTWFGLAAGLIGVYVSNLQRQRRTPRRV